MQDDDVEVAPATVAATLWVRTPSKAASILKPGLQCVVLDSDEDSQEYDQDSSEDAVAGQKPTTSPWPMLARKKSIIQESTDVKKGCSKKSPVNLYDYLESDEVDEWSAPPEGRITSGPEGGAVTAGSGVDPAASLRPDPQEGCRDQPQKSELFSFPTALPLMAEEEEDGEEVDPPLPPPEGADEELDDAALKKRRDLKEEVKSLRHLAIHLP